MSIISKIKNWIFDPRDSEVEYDYPEGDDIRPINSGVTVEISGRSKGDTKGIVAGKTSGKDDILYTFQGDSKFPSEKLSEIMLTCPQSIEEASISSSALEEGKGLIVVLEKLNTSEAQRIIDFLSGATHILKGSITEISDRVFIAAPKGLDITDEHKATLAKNGLLPKGKFKPFTRGDR